MKLASVDIGLKRIGVAFCFDKKVVLPQNAIIRKGRNQAAKELSELLKEWGIDQLIVGLPKGGSSEEEMERRIKHFISLLEIEGIDTVYIDESFSSFEAKEQMQGVVKQKRDGRLDSIAAKIILERYLSTINY
ncbi:MAG TPA: Holliday junction resolvase RuvX [Nitratifractor sp.]|nr:Holliday junction resolvase RuvX [Nitratifractor sp.]HHD75127.1 Holliday junction resolvase RuvX [Nitratifractor sp.]